MLFRGDYEEKRDFTRMGLECPATLRIDGEETVHQAVATDLSATGLQLDCALAVAEGGVVMVEMIPEQAIVPPLQARAEVVRCTGNEKGGYRLGLRIVEMMPGL
ncbi:MAG: PilZ domain-containing protein [Gammaproteobacteria bacterium]|nr:PilZ domain-containing protein [Gammaproteobacteria bacterium]